MNFSETEKQYKKLSIKELIELSIEGFYLSEEDRDILKKELISRGREAEALSMDTMFEEQTNLKDLSIQELRELIAGRLKMGESAESIAQDLSEQGISMPELPDMEKESEIKNEMFETIAFYKQRGADQQVINKRLKEKYDLDEHDVVALKKDMKSHSMVYIIVGSLLTGVSIAMAIASFMHNGIFLLIGFFVTGVPLLIKGIRLRR